jgi:large subunit ribosomal protein L10
VAKNTYMRKVLAEAGLPDISVGLVGQTAFVMGESEVFAAAKTIKNFEKEFKKPEMKIGLLGNAVLDGEKLRAIADIPSREAVLSQLLGTILEPASMIARVIKNKFDPDDETSPKEEPEGTPAAESTPLAEEAAAPAETAAEATTL